MCIRDSLSSAEVLAALRYIEEHKEEVLSNYRTILERNARGNPPEVQEKLDAIDAKYRALWSDRLGRAGMLENGDDGHPGGH